MKQSAISLALLGMLDGLCRAPLKHPEQLPSSAKRERDSCSDAAATRIRPCGCQSCPLDAQHTRCCTPVQQGGAWEGVATKCIIQRGTHMPDAALQHDASTPGVFGAAQAAHSFFALPTLTTLVGGYAIIRAAEHTRWESARADSVISQHTYQLRTGTDSS